MHSLLLQLLEQKFDLGRSHSHDYIVIAVLCKLIRKVRQKVFSTEGETPLMAI